ncbi:oxysterol-binding protein-related protein 9-like protein [Sarcoptes scabiei]|uniref:Oxysterol-binding protein n=1 Tax=Sarcoptes scabiei TaxID=52283 RepID=A0A132AHM7_SARSC|nr:oxysterol-binding protein-related protein 9-like protein [Sarcoptes scabiei]
MKLNQVKFVMNGLYQKRRFNSNKSNHLLSVNRSIFYCDSSKLTIEDFQKRLIETDSYLQILIKQIQKLDNRIESLEQQQQEKTVVKQESSSKLSDSEEISLEKLKKLRERLIYFLDSIKHTIVLLQISKNIKFPIKGVYKQEKTDSINQLINDEPGSLECGANSLNPITDSDNHLDDECESNHDFQLFPTSSTSSRASIENSITNVCDLMENFQPVPEVSYASSDEEEFFFDANEDQNLNHTDFEEIANNQNKLAMNFQSSKMKPIENIDFDQIYDFDEDSTDEFCTVASHGSVISHLITQVKIGMDLTKVTLPTFILERRSLLEMYADFFAHADIFVSIPDFKTPRERMIQVTRWYLSAFHAGRKGSIAKKPYNPVLGEIFRCYWNLSDKNSDLSVDGPVPWARKTDLVFVAEQVSHHPPISAFYAENVSKKIMCCGMDRYKSIAIISPIAFFFLKAQIYTKSKFLGLSIGVNNIGTGMIHLLDHGETYTCTFPSAYGRSILTEPWFELGGCVEICCEKTGYSSKIEFLTKPFYGGKRNRVSAEILDPSKKVIGNISGEWNGRMEAKWSNGSSKSELFVDTKTLPIIKKQVKSINEQEEFESRNLWKYVTLALKRQDVLEASKAKYSVEQRQRDLVKERQSQGIKWKNRMFTESNEKWIYNHTLEKRSI